MLSKRRLRMWRRLCQWLDQQPRKSAYQSSFPDEFRLMVYVGGNPTGARAREERYATALIFYRPGRGWRLRANWRARLAELEKERHEAWMRMLKERLARKDRQR